MGMTDIESPKLWSEIRRIDALNRAKAMAQDFERGTTLFWTGAIPSLSRRLKGTGEQCKTMTWMPMKIRQ